MLWESAMFAVFSNYRKTVQKQRKKRAKKSREAEYENAAFDALRKSEMKAAQKENGLIARISQFMYN